MASRRKAEDVNQEAGEEEVAAAAPAEDDFEEVPMIRTRDGEMFASRAAAAAHMAVVNAKEEVETYLDKRYPPGENGRRSHMHTLVGNAVADYLAYQARRGAGETPEEILESTE